MNNNENDKKKFKRFRKQAVKSFDTPPNYFDEFALRIQNELPGTAESTSWWSKMAYRLQFRFSFSILVVIILATIGLVYSPKTVLLHDDQYADLETYLMEDEIDGIDESLVLEIYTEELAEVVSQAEEESDETIIDYLLEEEIDDSLIINEMYYSI